MSQRFDCSDPAQLAEGLQEAQAALRRGQLVVMPTDTVYAIAAEAFDSVAVDRLLTLIVRSSPTLVWDIGETKGTVGIRMPLHHVALGLLKKTGPLVVTSAKYAAAETAPTSGPVFLSRP